MNTIIQLNDSLAHLPTGAVAILFAVALGYILKTAAFFQNRFIPLVVVGITAILFAFVQLCEDYAANKPHPWLSFLLNFLLGVLYGFFAWALHAQILKRFVDPKVFNDDGSTKFFTKPDSNPTDNQNKNQNKQ